MAIKKHIPNSLTACNLFCGCVGIWAVFQGRMDWAAYAIWLASVFDFLDGFAARLLKVQSAIGKELDSLADMVTFGVLPAFIMFSLLQEQWEHPYIPFVGFSLAIFSAFRLAKFNIDTRQSDQFIGVPTPANALLVSGVAISLLDTQSVYQVLNTGPILLVITLVMSYLLVAELPLLALKFKSFAWSGNQSRYILVVLSVAELAIWQVQGIPLLIVTYIVLSVLVHFFQRKS